MLLLLLFQYFMVVSVFEEIGCRSCLLVETDSPDDDLSDLNINNIVSVVVSEE